MESAAAWNVATSVLRASSYLNAEISLRVQQAGFGDVRPVDGFVFLRVSAGPTTITDIAGYLGITKQAASQLVEQLVARGYLERRPSPFDARSRVLALTEHGRHCTQAAERAIADIVSEWEAAVGRPPLDELARALRAAMPPGPLHPGR